jgi:hypothetical protein
VAYGEVYVLLATDLFSNHNTALTASQRGLFNAESYVERNSETYFRPYAYKLLLQNCSLGNAPYFVPRLQNQCSKLLVSIDSHVHNGTRSNSLVPIT